MVAFVLAGPHQDVLIVDDPRGLDEDCRAEHVIEVIEAAVNRRQLCSGHLPEHFAQNVTRYRHLIRN